MVDMICPVDSEGEGRGSSGPAKAGWCRRGNVAKERHEPSDGRAGERALEQPRQPRPLAIGKRRPSDGSRVCVQCRSAVSHSQVCLLGNCGFGARGRRRDGGQWRSVGRQQLQPLQHLKELPSHLQSALLLQGIATVCLHRFIIIRTIWNCPVTLWLFHIFLQFEFFCHNFKLSLCFAIIFLLFKFFSLDLAASWLRMKRGLSVTLESSLPENYHVILW